jgi:hypothetical protein
VNGENGPVPRRLTRRVIEEEEGKTSGRKDRLRGQMGVRTRALREGWTIGPPAESEYAVEPVGVETMRPSDCRNEICRSVDLKETRTHNRLCEMLAVDINVYGVEVRTGPSVQRNFVHHLPSYLL